MLLDFVRKYAAGLSLGFFFFIPRRAAFNLSEHDTKTYSVKLGNYCDTPHSHHS